MKKALRTVYKRIIRLIYPKRCPNCGEIVPIEREYCSCSENIIVKLSDDFCVHCAKDKDDCICGMNGSVYLENVVAVYVYTGLIKEKLLNMKFHGEKSEADFFALKMSLRFAAAYPNVEADYITFVPMDKEDIRERGYNQSEILAAAIGKKLGVSCGELIFKNRKTLKQHTLTQKQRLENLVDAFCVNDKFLLKNKTVLLCDDIKTTGTTLRRCCDILYAAGVKEVYCLCAAVSDFSNLPF